MKYIFASLLCHRDVDVFEFNWFCMRIHLNKGFDIGHLILSDGSLTDKDKTRLSSLPGVVIEEQPATVYDAPKAILLAKLECLLRGFHNQHADRVVVFDADIFFFRNWESDLRKILTERAVVLRDWGSSLGPNVAQYRALYGVHEDQSTPNCNTGVISVQKEDYWKIEEVLDKHLNNPFQIMEDQGIVFAAFYGELSYADGIVCVCNNAEYSPDLWAWALRQNAAHLMGMRVRLDGLQKILSYARDNLPKTIPLKQISPIEKKISWGMMEYDTYHFAAPYQRVPSTCQGRFETDSLYLHGGSHVRWNLPPYFTRFESSKVVCADTGIAGNLPYVLVNGKKFPLNQNISVPIYARHLEIQIPDGPGTHAVFLRPKLSLEIEDDLLGRILERQKENVAHMA